MEILLTVTAGPHQGREFSFSSHDTFLVGRSKTAHFQLDAKDKYFSRVHFLVEVNPPRCRLVDLNSRNGTFVNDQRIRQTELHDGDKIKAGHTILRVSFRSSPVEQADAIPQPPGEETRSWHENIAPLTANQGEEIPVLAEASAVESSLPAVGGYRLIRDLGRGGMGVVYLAEDADGSPVAIKTVMPAIIPTRNQVERFLREAKILQQLCHPNIVSFREMGEANGLLYFVMDYVAGSDAAQLMKQHGRLPMRAAVRLLCQLLDALEYAHDQGFVHRDIKPANVLIAETKGRKVKLADFGLARVYQTSQLSGLTMSGDIGGTVKFMPPEQITNYREVKPAADQYSAAATLYYLLTEFYPHDFTHSSLQPLVQILEEEPLPIDSRGIEIPEELGEVIHRALARDPRRRFANVAAFRQALVPFGR